MTMTRRAFARSALAAPLAAAAPLALGTAGAQVAGPAPAPVARIGIGRFTVTFLTDGYLDMPFGYFTGPAQETIAEAAQATHADRGEAVRLSFTQYLIEDGDSRVLIDTGPAGAFGPTTGKLGGALAGLGVAAEQIDAVILTHAHADHISGAVADGAAAYPEAEVYIDRRDVAYFTDGARRAAVPDFLHSSFDATGRLVEATPRLQQIEGAHQFLPGLETIDLTGHTPGHVGVRVVDGGESLLIVSDMLFHPLVHPASAANGFIFEQDPAAAEALRAAFFPAAAEEGALIAATHMPFPGLGRIGRADGALTWVPADWAHGV